MGDTERWEELKLFRKFGEGQRKRLNVSCPALVKFTSTDNGKPG